MKKNAKTAVCTICGKKQPTKKFGRRGYYADGTVRRRSACRKCEQAKSPKRKRLSAVAKAVLNAETHGLAVKEYNRLLQDQDGLCAICYADKGTKTGRGLALDHCHKTGKIRGFLCSNCNTGLGLFQDSAFILRKAAIYLENAESGVA